MPTAPAPYRPLRDDVRDRIRDLIVDGAYAPGSRLVERTIAADLGVSRIPVREALQALVLEGFAVDRDTRGIAVRTYDAREIAELAGVGAALERVLVGHVVDGVTVEGLAPLRTVLDEARVAIERGDVEAAVAANSRFHDVLASLGEGTMAHEVLAIVSQRRRWLLAQHSDPAPIHAEHVELYEAIAGGDRARAQQITEDHVRTTIENALRAEGSPS
ncbi:GntR family transcriptional regulator [Aeromicrobium sp. Marseille-Q0843]|uniref:GntR family transcriptional regulator n=1 Tax=Aeromicrobium phoceense TaxID=2754045 RepID=A0A838XNE9_9ACTN|nr:GntR family transcriptional regulator [Aeromicrobium phoceense]MBA4608514.1 GntR family transcriptional regulator [Aeromicrobium phoceense]